MLEREMALSGGRTVDPTWTDPTRTHPTWTDPAWTEIDRNLRAIARRRAALDVDEARWLVMARRKPLHRQFGYARLEEYLERVLGRSSRWSRAARRATSPTRRRRRVRHAMSS